MAQAIFPDELSNLPSQNYDAIRRSINTGDFLFCSGDYLISNLIKGFTNSAWSHVGTIVRLEEFDRLFVLESVEDCGIRFIPLSNYLENYANNSKYNGTLVIGKPTSQINLASGIDWAFEKVGTAFDKQEVLSIAAKIIGDGGDYTRNNRFICSELVESIWRLSGYEINHDNRGFISPNNIWLDDIVGDYFRIL